MAQGPRWLGLRRLGLRWLGLRWLGLRWRAPARQRFGSRAALRCGLHPGRAVNTMPCCRLERCRFARRVAPEGKVGTLPLEPKRRGGLRPFPPHSTHWLAQGQPMHGLRWQAQRDTALARACEKHTLTRACEEDALARAGAANQRSADLTGGALTGRDRVTANPPPAGREALAAPPQASMELRTMARPRPLPPVSRLRERSGR